MKLHKVFKNIYLEVRSAASKNALFYRLLTCVIFLLKKEQRIVRVRRDSELVVEGFPRSANTFMVTIFELAGASEKKIARHLHDSFQVAYAERKRIPCVVLIRDPLECVSSAILRDSDKNIKTMLRSYIRFYEHIRSVRKRCVIVTFEDAIKNPNEVIRAVNNVYGLKYNSVSKEDMTLVPKLVKIKDSKALGDGFDVTRSAMPSDGKKIIKDEILCEMQLKYPELVSRAEVIYSELIKSNIGD